MNNLYATQVQWGGASKPWHANGTLAIGARDNQPAVAVDINSDDGGNTFTGSMTYKDEGPIGFRATRFNGNAYSTEVQWGGSSKPWHANGVWVIGGRDNQRAVKLGIESSDNGKTFSGTMTYSGEGPIGFKAEAV